MWQGEGVSFLDKGTMLARRSALITASLGILTTTSLYVYLSPSTLTALKADLLDLLDYLNYVYRPEEPSPSPSPHPSPIKMPPRPTLIFVSPFSPSPFAEMGELFPTHDIVCVDTLPESMLMNNDGDTGESYHN